MHKVEVHLQVTVDPHGNSFTFNRFDNEIKVNSSDNLGLGGEERFEGELAFRVLGNDLQTSNGGFDVHWVRGVGLRGPGTNLLLGEANVGVDSRTYILLSSLLLGHALRDLSLNVAQVVSTSHPKVTFVTPGGVPRVGKFPEVLSVVVGSPSSHLNTVTTEVLAGGRGVDAVGVKGKVGVEVLENGEASLKGTVSHQSGLVGFEIMAEKTRKRHVGASSVGLGPI